jgi:hypothetical protein
MLRRRLFRACVFIALGVTASAHPQAHALADSKVHVIEARIKSIRDEVTSGDFVHAKELTQLESDLVMARKVQKQGVVLVSTLFSELKQIRKKVADGDFTEAAQLPKLEQELLKAHLSSKREDRPKAIPAMFSPAEDKRTLVILNLMRQVEGLRRERDRIDTFQNRIETSATMSGGKSRQRPWLRGNKANVERGKSAYIPPKHAAEHVNLAGQQDSMGYRTLHEV